MSSSETELVERAQQGDRRAFASLVEPHRRKFWGVAYRITTNQADAEDALQDALVAIWQGLDRFRGDASFSTWCFRIVSNAALAVIRRRTLTTELPEEMLDDSSDFTNEIADRDRVQAALRLIPEEFRVALVLREYGDFSYQEIADHQGILIDTVKSRIHRGRSALREALAQV